MTDFEAQDPDYETRVRASFMRQRVMETIGAEMTKVAPGEVEIALPFRADLTQQNGYLHAGIVAAIIDSACGYAAMSLTPAGGEVLSIEFKLNLLSPAAGESFVARGRVKRAGRNVTVCTGDLFALNGDGAEKLVATMLATMMNVRERA